MSERIYKAESGKDFKDRIFALPLNEGSLSFSLPRGGWELIFKDEYLNQIFQDVLKFIHFERYPIPRISSWKTGGDFVNGPERPEDYLRELLRIVQEMASITPRDGQELKDRLNEKEREALKPLLKLKLEKTWFKK